MTEYRRSYQPSQFRCAAANYFDNREFRLQQLQRFQNHSTDPFVWPDDNDNDDDCCTEELTTGCCDETCGRVRRALFEPPHHYRLVDYIFRPHGRIVGSASVRGLKYRRLASADPTVPDSATYEVTDPEP